MAYLTVPQRFQPFIVADDFTRYGLDPGVPARSPKYLQMELTDLCNLKCAGCVRAAHDSVGTHLAIEDFTDLLDQLPDLEQVSFVGAGEALIVRDFSRYVTACTRRGLFSSTNTNGLLVRRRLEPALAAGLGLLAVSVDGADDATLGVMRSGLRTSQLSASLAAARDLTSRYGARLSAAVTLSAANLHTFADIVGFVVRCGVTEITVESLHHWGADKTLNAQSLFALDPAQVIPALERGLDVALEAAVKVSIFDYTRIGNAAAQGAICPWPWDALYVTKDLDVTPCCVNMEAEPHNVLGNAATTVMTDMWRGAAMDSLRRSFTSDAPTWESCQGCVYRMEFGRVPS